MSERGPAGENRRCSPALLLPRALVVRFAPGLEPLGQVVQDDLDQDVIAIRPIMNLTLTYDHRLVDGALAGRFLRDLRQRLQNWEGTGD